MPYKRIRRTAPRRRAIKRRRVVRRKRKTLNSRIKEIALRNNELKRCNGTLNVPAQQLGDTLYSTFLATPPYQDTLVKNDWNSRDGQEIIYRGYYCKGFLRNLPTTIPSAGVASQTYMRILVLLQGTGMSGTGDLISTTPCWMTPNGDTTNLGAILGSMACMTYKVDPKFYRTLTDRVYTVGNDGNGVNCKRIAIKKKMNMKIKFNGRLDGTASQDKKITMYWWAWSPQGSALGLFNPYYWQFEAGGYFKDPN